MAAKANNLGWQRWLRCTAALLYVMGVVTAAGPSAPVAASEEQVRAAFLFQLAQYAHWPPDAFPGDSAPIRFCVLGQDTMAVMLAQAVRGKSIEGHPISVIKISEARETAACHVAFIGFDREKQLRAVFAAAAQTPVLLVGETDRFVEFGGMVNLVLDRSRVSFEINLDATRRARLDFRSQLLRFARIVSDQRGAGK